MATKENDTCLQKSAPGEPLFVLCGRDELAPEVIDYWIELAAMNGVPSAKVEDARQQLENMRQWQKENRQAVKLPD